ncbi:paraquat-inducible protein A [Herbaspirillum sp. NPDC087042]|uniref:paraquat-inducible protein A n=1 Tax=Herbaspirillum sp. NPDC087042 TaxID=3364004 RepID=UPI0037F152C8
MSVNVCSASTMGLLSCRQCQRVHADSMDSLRCLRCGHPLHRAHALSLTRCAMLLAMAALAFLAAGLLTMSVADGPAGPVPRPLMATISAGWHAGDMLAVILLTVSALLFPLLRLGLMAMLLLTAWQGWRQPPRRLATLLRWQTGASRCAMLPLVIASLAASCAGSATPLHVHPGPALLVLALSTLLTTLATRIFDARLLWHDAAGLAQALSTE